MHPDFRDVQKWTEMIWILRKYTTANNNLKLEKKLNGEVINFPPVKEFIP